VLPSYNGAKEVPIRVAQGRSGSLKTRMLRTAVAVLLLLIFVGRSHGIDGANTETHHPPTERELGRTNEVRHHLGYPPLNPHDFQSNATDTRNMARASVSVLIYGPSLSVIIPNEQTIAQSLGFSVTVVNAATWLTMTTAQFQAYNALIVPPDPGCTGSSASWAAAVASAPTWAAAITGNALVFATDPVLHGKTAFLTAAISGVASGPGTGLFASMECVYYNAASGTTVPILAGLGSFTIRGQSFTPCGDDISIVSPTFPPMSGLVDADLSNWSTTTHGEFESWPAGWFTVAADRCELTKKRVSVPSLMIGRAGIIATE